MAKCLEKGCPEDAVWGKAYCDDHGLGGKSQQIRVDDKPPRNSGGSSSGS